MAPARSTTQGASMAPSAKKRAIAIVIGQALGVTRAGTRRAVAKPTLTAQPPLNPAAQSPRGTKALTVQSPPCVNTLAMQPPLSTTTLMMLSPPSTKTRMKLSTPSTKTLLMLSPPCTNSLTAPKVSPAKREHAKRKLATSPRAATMETRSRTTRRVNRRILDDPSFDTSSADPPSTDTAKTLRPSVECGEPKRVVALTAPTAATIFMIPSQLKANTKKLPESSPVAPPVTRPATPQATPPVSPRESHVDALPSDEHWWDMTFTKHVLAGSKIAPTRPAIETAEPVILPSKQREPEVWTWTAQLKREAFAWILYCLHNHLEIGYEKQLAELTRYLEMPQSTQGLFVSGSSAQSTGTIIRSLLYSLDGTFGGRQLDVTVVKGELYSSSEEIYSSIRARLKCKWDFPPWRRLDEFMQRGETVPPLDTSKLSVVVLENIDPHVKVGDSKQPTLDRFLRFLNAHVLARGMKLIVIGHEPKTVRRFSRQIGGFCSPDVHQYVLRLPESSFVTLAAHIEAVIARAVTTMTTTKGADAAHHSPPPSSLLNDLFAPKVIQFATQKALKQNQCELDPVLAILRRALVRMLSSCRYRSENFETDASRWRLRYEHVTAVTTEYFKHDYVHRIQCVGVIPQTVLLVLIDSGACTEEQLFQHVWERRLVHSWVMVVAMFRSSMFVPALELLLSVPVVKKREIKVYKNGVWRVEQELYALPTREHLIEAAGNVERIKLLL